MAGTTYLSESQIKSYCLDDPILDYLPHIKDTSSIRDDQLPNFNPDLHFGLYVSSQLKSFTSKIKEWLNSNSNSSGISFHDCGNSDKNFFEVMKSGVGIIWNPVIPNHQLRINTKPTYLIRYDMLHKIFPHTPKLTGVLPSTYLVVNIVYQSIDLTSKGLYQTTDPFKRYYKTKSVIQSMTLDKIQGVTTGLSLFQGRKYTYSFTKNKIKSKIDYNSTFDRLAICNVDASSISYAQEAIQHASNLNTALPDTVFPNMKNKHDFPWHHMKKKIAEDTGELTDLWYCSKEKADTFRNTFPGIIDWKNKLVTASNLDIRGERGDLLDRIININRNTSEEVIDTRSVSIDHLPQSKVEFYIDFETLNGVYDTLDSFPLYGGQELIYNIGVGYSINGGPFQFKSFFLDSISQEKDMMNQFFEFIESTAKKYGLDVKECPIYHYTGAELVFLKSYFKKDPTFESRVLKEWYWFDLERYLRTHSVVIKGAMNYRLKSIARAFKRHGFIETEWGHTCSDGLSAMTAYISYLEGKLKRHDPVIIEIIEYNEIDCKVMYEIKKYLDLKERKV